MKIIMVIIFLIGMLFLGSCRSDSVVGTWRVVRTNTSAQDTWEAASGETVEFRADGNYEFTGVRGSQKGNYIVDNNVLPNRLILTGRIKGRGNYKIDGNKLLIKISLLNDQIDFPADFGIQQYFQVIECERK